MYDIDLLYILVLLIYDALNSMYATITKRCDYSHYCLNVLNMLSINNVLYACDMLLIIGALDVRYDRWSSVCPIRHSGLQTT